MLYLLPIFTLKLCQGGFFLLSFLKVLFQILKPYLEAIVLKRAILRRSKYLMSSFIGHISR